MYNKHTIIKWASYVVLVVKNLPANAGLKIYSFDPYIGKIPGGVHSNRLQYSYQENPMDCGA